MTKRKIIIPGGSGFLGRTLATWLQERGDEVVVLSRFPGDDHRFRTVTWDARTCDDWVAELEGATAVVNLTGRSVNCRYTQRNRQAILDSRVLSTRVLGEAVSRCQQPPRVWLNSSTATIYRHTYGPPHDEAGEIAADKAANDEFSIKVARDWESAFNECSTPATRKIVLRTAMVLGREPGGVFEVLRRLTRWGLGGKMGSGRQFVSWLHANDFCRAIDWLIEDPHAAGVYNLSAPSPVTNAEMMAILRRSLHRPIGLPAARWMLSVGAFLMRTETELVIKSRRVAPSRLLADGFSFQYPELEHAVSTLL